MSVSTEDRRARRWTWVACAFLCVACARTLPTPDAGGGESCARDADCNRADGGAAARTCGVLRACVAGRCEERTPDGGDPGAWVRACGAPPADAGQ